MGKDSRRKREKKKRIAEERPVARWDEAAGTGVSTGLMRKRLVQLILLAFLGFAAYSNTFHVPFQFDDVEQIAKNPVVTGIGNFFSNSAGYSFNPRRFVGYLTFALNYHFGGYDVEGYHVVNLAIHLMNGILMYFIIILTFKTPYFRRNRQWAAGSGPKGPQSGERGPDGSQSLIAFFAALLFVIHPMETQAVTYIVQRLTSLATMFYLLSLVMYVKYRLKSQNAENTPHWAGQEGPDGTSYGRGSALPAVPYAVCSLLFAVLAMKTKEISFTLPIVIMLYEFLFFKSSLKKKILILLPLLLTLAIIPLSILGTDRPLGDLLSDLSEKTRVQTGIPRWDYLMTQMRVITTYIRLLFLPVNQNLDYDYPIYHSLSQPPVILSSLFLFSLLGLGVYLLRRSSLKDGGLRPEDGSLSPRPLTSNLYRLIGFGIFWFFITLSVESSLIPIADVMFEHRVYLPSVGAFIAVSAAGVLVAGNLKARWPRLDRAVIASCFIIITTLLVATHSRNAIWQDRLSLWQDVVLKSPDKGRGYNDLGNAYNRAGMLDEAENAYLRAITLSPDSFDAHNDLGIVYAKKNRINDAIREFKEAMALKPDYARPHSNLGILYDKMNDMGSAIDEFTRAIVLNPNNSDAYKNRGIAYAKIGQTLTAAEDFRKACAMGNRQCCEFLNNMQ